jgi:PAS domain S-box-containing protein
MSHYHQNEESKLKPNLVVYAHDLNGNFTFLNEAGEQILGYSREEVCRMNLAEVVPAEIVRQVHKEIARGVPKHVGIVYETEIIAKDGHRVPLEVSTEVVVREGRPVGIEGIAIPLVIESQPPSSARSSCLDPDFFFGN